MARSKPQTEKAGPADKAIKVTSKREGFWRAGLQFGHTPRVVPLADLTPEQAEAIRDEPMLVVEEVDAPKD